jgi:hypothetical protein
MTLLPNNKKPVEEILRTIIIIPNILAKLKSSSIDKVLK